MISKRMNYAKALDFYPKMNFSITITWRRVIARFRLKPSLLVSIENVVLFGGTGHPPKNAHIFQERR